MTRMILLGVGTAVPDVDRENTHMVWDGPDGPLLIDVGGSTYQRLLRADVDPQQLHGIFLTHNHADHINGLPVLLFSMALAGRSEPIMIYGLDVTLKAVQRILDVFQLEHYMVPVRWRPVEAGEVLLLASSAQSHEHWLLRTAQTKHARPCLALRFEDQIDDVALTYSCDTAPCQSVADLAQGTNILIHEATTAEPSDTHTTPRQAGEVAQQVGAERLIIVHYSPRWTMPEERALEEIRASGFSGTAEIGRENQVISLLAQ